MKNDKMRRLVVVVFMCGTWLLTSCDDKQTDSSEDSCENDSTGYCEEPFSTTLPEGFGDFCDTDTTSCSAPFECLETVQGPQCTTKCAVEGDCPTWVETGHCGGTHVAPCENGTCTSYGCM